ncbi:MAG: helix-turn-helix domain-containing protein [Bacillota bacterium]|nr:helix-turn-helix domain-containing protein [Bacillota bacterium]
MLADALKTLGLTRHESQVYITITQKGQQTGYEIANVTGIARSNVYAALSSLAEKGIIYKINEDPARYVGIPPDELKDKVLRTIEQAADTVIDNLYPQDDNTSDLVVSLEGEETISDKVIYLINSARATLYIDAAAEDLRLFSDHLIKARERGIKVVIISLGKCPVEGMLVYENQSPATWIVSQGRPIRLIIDSGLMLNGEMGRGKSSRGLYSSNATLVMMAKHSFTQEIILTEVRKKFENQLMEVFGTDFSIVREKVSSSRNRSDEKHV